MIKTFKAETFIEKLFCDCCHHEMIATGKALISNPPQFPHECTGCGVVENITNFSFPNAIIREVEVHNKDFNKTKSHLDHSG